MFDDPQETRQASTIYLGNKGQSMAISLVLGGARSGKTTYAEKQAAQSGKAVIYIATADAQHAKADKDAELQARIKAHRDCRPDNWETVECPLALAASLRSGDVEGRVQLVDCLTMWVTNLLCHEDADLMEQEKRVLLDCLAELQGDVIFVSNEVSLGVIPMGELTRRYVDEAGALHQAIAAVADEVVLVAAGLPLFLKQSV